MEGRGFHTRGYLPHIEALDLATFITFRLADSLPAHVIEELKNEVAHLELSERRSKLWKSVEAYLDAGAGACLLQQPANARFVMESLKFVEAQERCKLIAWVVMPNHVHLLAEFREEVGKVIQSIKRHTSRRIGQEGRLWQPDYFDRIIRDEEHLKRTAEYIEWNPVKAGLCRDPKKFVFSSAYES